MSILKAFGQLMVGLGILWLVYFTAMLAMNSWWIVVWMLGWGTLLMWTINKAIG